MKIISKFIRLVIKQFRLNTAQGQLIILIVLPIIVLMIVGSWLIYYQTKENYLAQQYYEAQSILISHTHRIRSVMQGHSKINIETELSPILAEKNVTSAYVITNKLIIGTGKPIQDFDFYNYFKNYSSKKEGIKIQNQYYYEMPIDSERWLVIEMNHDKLEILKYRMLLIMSVMTFSTILFLTIIIYFFIRYWLSPLYRMRNQIQRLTSHNLNDYKVVHSSGELWVLQLDILHLLKQLNRDFQDLNLQVQEENYSISSMLDDMELQLVQYRNDLKSMHSMNQMKVMFLTNISHELKTPLNSIEGFVQLLLRQDSLNNEQQLYLQTIKKSSSHLLALINDILDYSKIEAGKLQLDMRWFNLENALYDVLDMLSPLATQKNLPLIYYYAADVPTMVLGDELRLKQIVMNLVSNAIKFTVDGEIIIRVRVEKKLDKNNYLLHFSVQDSGIGIKKSKRDKLFESFSQADISITRQYGGTGLGLAISKELAQMMKGSIGVDDNQNVIGTGATFWFTAQFTADQLIKIDIQQWQDIDILYHLQYPAVARVLRYYLDEYHIHYKEASSVYDFLSLLKDYQMNARQWVILDYVPNMEKVLQQIREYYQGYLVVYGDVMVMDMSLLQRYQVITLAQPIYRQALWQLFNEQPTHMMNLIKPSEFNGQYLNILAVDDHLPNLLVLEALLQTFNIQLIKATSGQQALAMIEQQQAQFDLIFMDIQMPMMSGLDTTRAIRSLESTLDIHEPIPIIALSAHILEEEKQNLYECGMNDSIEKPIQLDELNQILHKWIKKNTHRLTPTLAQTNKTEASESSLAILDWELSVRLSAQKEDLAKNLLNMLIANFEQEQQDIAELIELEDFPQLEQILHRIYGATRYVGTPQLQKITSEFEQFVSQLRKRQCIADDVFARQVQQQFAQLKQAMKDVEQAVKNLSESSK